MVRNIAIALLSVSTLAASAANADIAFSFADPFAGTQFVHTQGGGGGNNGLLTYNQNAVITFNVDGSGEGLGSLQYTNARLETNLIFGLGTVTPGGIVVPVTGTFTIYDFTGNVRTNLLTGTATAGAFFRTGNTSSILFSDASGFAYSAAGSLAAWLPVGTTLGNPQEAVFTITNLVVANGQSLLDNDGVVRSFTANSSYSGNAALVPTPGAMAMLGLGGLAAARRRR